MLFKVPTENKYNAYLVSNQCSTHIKTTCITIQLNGLKHWLDVGLCKINKPIKVMVRKYFQLGRKNARKN